MNQRDIELLSAYLDGELKPSDSARLETRLKTDPELVSAFNDLRAARTLLRRLPSRKAPRNFTLTRKMVGQNPPLPRTYPLFRYVTALATLLFFFSFAANAFVPQFMQPYGFGGGGGNGVEESEMFAAEAPAMEAPAAPVEEPAAPAPEEPSAASEATGEGEPPVALAPMPTEILSAEDAARVVETPAAKAGEVENTVAQDQPQVQKEPPLVSSIWQIGLAVVALLSALFMGLLRQLSARRWK